MTSSSDENLNRPATGPKVSSVAINYLISPLPHHSQKRGTYAFIAHVREDRGHVFGSLSSFTPDEDLGSLRYGILYVLYPISMSCCPQKTAVERTSSTLSACRMWMRGPCVLERQDHIRHMRFVKERPTHTPSSNPGPTLKALTFSASISANLS